MRIFESNLDIIRFIPMILLELKMRDSIDYDDLADIFGMTRGEMKKIIKYIKEKMPETLTEKNETIYFNRLPNEKEILTILLGEFLYEKLKGIRKRLMNIKKESEELEYELSRREIEKDIEEFKRLYKELKEASQTDIS